MEQEAENQEIFAGPEGRTIEERQDDLMSTHSRISKSTQRSLGKQSVRSSRTYVSQLEKKLSLEKKAREQLEKEVEELRKVSSAITSQIGFNKSQNRVLSNPRKWPPVSKLIYK